MEPDLAARKRLGVEVRQARRRAGYAKTIEWVEKVGRSDRMLLGLERGEPVGADTYAAVANALGWPLDRLYGILAGDVDTASDPTVLTDVSNEELVAEVLRRMRATGDGSDVVEEPTNVRELGPREDRTRVQKTAAKSKPRTEM